MEKHANRTMIEEEVKTILKKIHELDSMGCMDYYHTLSSRFLAAQSLPDDPKSTLATPRQRLRLTIRNILCQIGYFEIPDNNDAPERIHIGWMPSGYELVEKPTTPAPQEGVFSIQSRRNGRHGRGFAE